MEYNRIVVLNDIHVPYQDEKTLDLIFRFITEYKPTEIILLGDIIDFWQISKFRKDPQRKNTIQNDIDETSALLDQFAKLAKTTYVFGNHELRLKHYIFDRAQEIAGLRSLNLPFLLGLERLKIDYIEEQEGYIKRGDLILTHGTVVSQDSAMTARRMLKRFGLSVMCGHCFSEDTEILTKYGWKTFDKISIGEDVLTFNLNNKISEWNKIKDVFHYDNYKKLIHFKNKVCDLLVTPEHSIIGCTEHRKFNFKRLLAKNYINKRLEMPCGGLNLQKDFNIDDNLLKLLAWVITEGNYDKGRIRIHQSNKPKVGIKHITDICDNLGQKYSAIKRYDANSFINGQHRNYDAYRINLRVSEITKRIIELCPNKRLSWWLLNLSNRQFRLFFNEIILADGCKNKNAMRSYQYSSKHEEEIDILQALCAFNGWRTSKIKRKKENIYYVLTINTRGISTVKNGGKEIEYSGRVWCASVNNQTLIVRRNGKVIVSGNTHRGGSTYNTNLLGVRGAWENFCLCKMDLCKEWGFQIADWQQGFSTIDVIEDRFFIQQIPIINHKFIYGSQKYEQNC